MDFVPYPGGRRLVMQLPAVRPGCEPSRRPMKAAIGGRYCKKPRSSTLPPPPGLVAAPCDDDVRVKYLGEGIPACGIIHGPWPGGPGYPCRQPHDL